MIVVKTCAEVREEGAKRFEEETAAAVTGMATDTEEEETKNCTAEEDIKAKRITFCVTILSRDSSVMSRKRVRHCSWTSFESTPHIPNFYTTTDTFFVVCHWRPNGLETMASELQPERCF
jgi:hypothetical protein